MFNLPKSTQLKKPIYKNAIYKKFAKELSGSKKEEFDRDIKKITIIGEISENSVNIRAKDDIGAIFVVLIELKKSDFNNNNISLISRLFGQKLLIILNYGDKYRLSIYERKLFLGDWKREDEINLFIQGVDLSVVWENLVTQVAEFKLEEGNTLHEQIDKEEYRRKLKKLIDETEKKARKEQQAKKKFELFKEIKRLKREWEDL